MENFWRCFGYLFLTGVAAFFIGRILPKNWFRPELFPYRSYAFEKDGHIYDKLNVRKWQNKVPDMSKILPNIMPAKNLSGNFVNRMPLILQETCIAELIHSLLCISGMHCLKLWPGVGGVVVVFIYIVFMNLPFIIIQRYNRPRLIKISEKILTRQAAKEGSSEMRCEF